MAVLSLEQFQSDLSVNSQGIGSMSRRALAKMCGISRGSWGKGGRRFNAEIDEMLAAQGFEAAAIFNSEDRVIDIVCALVIKHYAYQGKAIAKQWDYAFSSIGIRAAIQDVCNYQPVRQKRLTTEEIIELCCLPCPTSWQRRFPIEYYAQLERLTGLKADGYKRPHLWAKLTKELVYDYLPSGVYDEIKRCQIETGSFDKLHQFLSEDGLLILEKHQRSLLAYMEAVSSLDELHRLIQQATTKRYQLLLF